MPLGAKRACRSSTFGDNSRAKKFVWPEAVMMLSAKAIALRLSEGNGFNCPFASTIGLLIGMVLTVLRNICSTFISANDSRWSRSGMID